MIIQDNTKDSLFAQQNIKDPEAFLVILKSLIENGDSVPLTVTGNSMWPFLKDRRDSVVLSKIVKPVKRGDIIFFVRENGVCIMHRVKSVKKERYYVVGDAQTYIEGPIRREQIIAKACFAERNGKHISEKSAVWKFFKYVWISVVRIRPLLIRACSTVLKYKNKTRQD